MCFRVEMLIEFRDFPAAMFDDSRILKQVNYMEFCQHLSAFNKRDPLKIQQLIKYSVMELRSVLKQDVMEAGLTRLRRRWSEVI